MHGPQDVSIGDDSRENLRGRSQVAAANAMVEGVAEYNDSLLDKFLEGEEDYTIEEVKAAIRNGTLQQPRDHAGAVRLRVQGQGRAERPGRRSSSTCRAPLRRPGRSRAPGPRTPARRSSVELQGQASPWRALVFKTISDPNGDLTFMRIYSGRDQAGREVLQRPHARSASSGSAA